MQERWQELVSGTMRGPGPRLARAALTLAASIYRVGLKANLCIYQTGLKRRSQPPVPVVSVGNLSLGGAGKTTAAAFIARRLQQRRRTGIVLRGYRRESGTEPVVVSARDGILVGLEQAGDEALMLARLLPECPVAVGKRRERVIETLVREAGVEAVVLDDGFQYFRMARTLDIVLLDALADQRLWRLFPAGSLREPPEHLSRADQIWITHADIAPQDRVQQLRSLAERHCPHGLLALTRHRTGHFRPFTQGTPVPGSLAGRRVLAVSALGNPESFERSLEMLGAQVAPLRYPDHYRYGPDDYYRILNHAHQFSAELVVTTEKDAVKLPPPPPDCLPILVLGCDLELIEGEEAVMASLDEL